ncbi:hypothetical protein AN958_11879 [Leucoagaricus sp. SymC.cos]|nr:hypothetical protein AN958_11879 [Leucoagaricus sp. SymC.cos]
MIICQVNVKLQSDYAHKRDDALLARLGYKSEFRRDFSLLHTIRFAFSIMGVCASVSTTFFFPLVTVATFIATAFALIIVSGSNRTSAIDAFTLLTNSSGWDNNDAAAHISEEVSSASRTAPIAILTGVLGTETLGFLLMIGASFASSNISRIVNTNLAMPMGQVYLDTFGKKGMLAVWSL